VRGRRVRGRHRARPNNTCKKENERKRNKRGREGKGIVAASRRNKKPKMRFVCGEADEWTDEEIQEDEGGQARAKAKKKQAGPIRFVVSSAGRRFFVLLPVLRVRRRVSVCRKCDVMMVMSVWVLSFIVQCSSPSAEGARER